MVSVNPSPNPNGVAELSLLLLQKVANFSSVERQESGRGKCPFEPTQQSAAVMVGTFVTVSAAFWFGLELSARSKTVALEGRSMLGVAAASEQASLTIQV